MHCNGKTYFRNRSEAYAITMMNKMMNIMMNIPLLSHLLQYDYSQYNRTGRLQSIKLKRFIENFFQFVLCHY